ncbi:electron transport complex subunit RsxG [Lonepinella sp. BR2919]|uniref:electron transport complex subunit RsxG n=1 Tax=unclassified Lonepinella TaxID=2642006 RepID=UPI003F6E2991
MNMGKIVSKYGLLLAFIALVCTAISGAMYLLTKDKINAVIVSQQRELLLQVIPQSYFDNDLMHNCVEPKTKQVDKICTALLKGKHSAYAIETIAPDGYSGNIRLLFGITPEGEILGVRVLEHHETPGLGDKIDTRISDWILSFSHKKISADNLNDWAVKKDGGKFDQFAGATLTPRAVVNQVKRSALEILNQ